MASNLCEALKNNVIALMTRLRVSIPTRALSQPTGIQEFLITALAASLGRYERPSGLREKECREPIEDPSRKYC
jgi:hypothetical protein